MSDQLPPEALAALREVLENQIAAGDPAETGAALKRLRDAGVAEQRAWQLLSAVLLQEMQLMLNAGEPFDRARYVAALERLPAPIKRSPRG